MAQRLGTRAKLLENLITTCKRYLLNWLLQQTKKIWEIAVLWVRAWRKSTGVLYDCVNFHVLSFNYRKLYARERLKLHWQRLKLQSAVGKFLLPHHIFYLLFCKHTLSYALVTWFEMYAVSCFLWGFFEEIFTIINNEISLVTALDIQ